MYPRATVLVAIVLAGCTPRDGTIPATVEPGALGRAEVAQFQWQADDRRAHSGTIVASFGDRTLRGTFQQLRPMDETNVHRWYGVWDGIGHRGEDPPWPERARDSFASRYTEKLSATLEGSGGATMICAFAVEKPSRGLAGGARGRCQIDDGTIVLAGERARDATR